MIFLYKSTFVVNSCANITTGCSLELTTGCSLELTIDNIDTNIDFERNLLLKANINGYFKLEKIKELREITNEVKNKFRDYDHMREIEKSIKKLYPNIDNVIYTDDDELTGNNIITYAGISHFNLHAIKDKKYPNKYLILYSIHFSYATEYTYGMTIYFDPSGNVVHDSKRYIGTYLFRSESPIEYYIWNNFIHLYNDKLLLFAPGKDRRTYSIDYVQLIESGRIIKTFTKYSEFSGEFVKDNDPRYMIIKKS